jgi:hypothetical protein
VTAGQLRAKLAGVDDAMEIMLEIGNDDLVKADLEMFTIESRCDEDEVERIYLWGNADEHD